MSDPADMEISPSSTPAPSPRPESVPLPAGESSAVQVQRKRNRAERDGEGIPTDKDTPAPPQKRPNPWRVPANILVGPQPFRITAPLPARSDTMALPAKLYDPLDFDGLPTCGNENPHFARTRTGEAPEQPTFTGPIHFTDGTLPLPFIPAFKLRGNINDEQLRRIDSPLMPSKALYVMVTGGGQGFFYLRHEEKIKAFRDVLEAFRYDGNDKIPELELILPIVKSPSKARRFAQPWTLILILGENEERLRRYLLWQRVFAIHATLAFTIYERVEEAMPWTIMILTGQDGAVTDSAALMRRTLARNQGEALGGPGLLRLRSRSGCAELEEEREPSEPREGSDGLPRHPLHTRRAFRVPEAGPRIPHHGQTTHGRPRELPQVAILLPRSRRLLQRRYPARRQRGHS
ncbi:hypothetical protein C8Q76DRAFT_438053 [Earliella scabrosa]|nr:hypothetical protein C8Q76DRAFT_438053 [Earliella scabrosa]